MAATALECLVSVGRRRRPAHAPRRLRAPGAARAARPAQPWQRQAARRVRQPVGELRLVRLLVLNVQGDAAIVVALEIAQHRRVDQEHLVWRFQFRQIEPSVLQSGVCISRNILES